MPLRLAVSVAGRVGRGSFFVVLDRGPGAYAELITKVAAKLRLMRVEEIAAIAVAEEASGAATTNTGETAGGQPGEAAVMVADDTDVQALRDGDRLVVYLK